MKKGTPAEHLSPKIGYTIKITPVKQILQKISAGTELFCSLICFMGISDKNRDNEDIAARERSFSST